METITFGGKSFSDFNVFWSGSDLFVTPDKDVSFFSIPGRSGDLSIFNNRFNNVEIDIECFCRTHFKRDYTNLVNYLYGVDGYQRFETSHEPDIYRLASFVKKVEPETGSFLKSGKFVLTFNFKPQKWLKSGEMPIKISNSANLVNPTGFDALPLIEVEGTGSITINDSMLSLANNTSVTFIDCDIQDCYEGTINRNPDLTIVGGFPVLQKENTITVSGFTSCKVYPRWWQI